MMSEPAPEQPLMESAWAWGWHDTKLALHSPFFWLAELVGGAATAAWFGPLVGAAFAAGVAALLWLWKTLRAPVLQRQEARELVRSLTRRGLRVTRTCVTSRPVASELTGAESPAKFIHLELAAEGHVVHDVTVTLQALARVADPMVQPNYGGTIDLVTEQTHERRIDIRPGQLRRFDVLAALTRSLNLHLWPPNKLTVPTGMSGFFDVPGIYLLTLFVSSDDGGPAQTVEVRVDWLGGFAALDDSRVTWRPL